MAERELHERFQTLLEEHKKILYKVSNLYSRNRDDRNDLTQEIIVELWRSFRKFDNRCRFSTWMYRVALNVAISFYRRESRRIRHVISAEQHLLAATADEKLGDDLRTLYQFIEQLDPLHKALILLYLEGNSYQEIAEILGITETNVGTKINRVKLKMKQQAN
jgi:RNA polymerase sigma factor (sigma-70 family)